MSLITRFRRARLQACLPWVLLAGVLIAPHAAWAQWRATVGAQSEDKGRQVLAFLPNEIWIHAGDSITWTFDADEIHTVTFLKPGQNRMPFRVGCPGFSPDGSAFDGSTCVTTGPSVKGQTFTVGFPVAGNFKLVCLVHENMTAVVHVLDPSEPLPYDQNFYDKEAADEQHELLSHREQDDVPPIPENHVIVGMGKISATAGGHETLSVMRFIPGKIVIHAGDTVEWTNDDPVTPHTITFGTQPANPVPPSANVTVDADGARHAVISSPSDGAHSGFIVAAPQERTGLSQSPLGVTRFRVTFTQAGVFPYICALHDDLGMKGEVIVLP